MRHAKIILIAIFISITLLPCIALSQDLAVPDVPRDKVICFALYTVQNNTLNLTAQLYPLKEGESRIVRLEIKSGGKWRKIVQTKVIEKIWIAPFRIERWNSNIDYEYRLVHDPNAYYEGIIRQDPIEKETIVVAAFSNNQITNNNESDIPKTDIINNIKTIKPDLLFFAGNQVCDHKNHYASWLKFGRDFSEILRNTPTVILPDTHDLGQNSLWGASGQLSRSEEGCDGGYTAPLEYINQVECVQTNHLPDPYDPTPVQRKIGTYYTSLTIGGVSFAILESRKFKSGPEGIIPRFGLSPDRITTPNYNPEKLDVPNAELLGERQLTFLRKWAADWRDCEMKAVLTQAVLSGGPDIYDSPNNRIYADLNTNGWPQTPRNNALKEIRKAFAPIIAGDHLLASVIHQGVDDWNDSSYSFCVPPIASRSLRWFSPLEPGKNRKPGMQRNQGEFLDGFANIITMLAVANPTLIENRDKLTTRAAGFGVIRFNKNTRQITFECWPRNVDISDHTTTQYSGWPCTISQEDNYARESFAYLPTLEISGIINPIVQVVNEANNEIIYTIRINGSSFKPKIFKPGRYTIKITGRRGSVEKTFKGLSPLLPGREMKIPVVF